MNAARAELAVAPIAVIGIGNVLLGDDGFGPAVIALLAARWYLPVDVELIDAGTPGLDLAGLLCGRDYVIFVDAVAAAAEPGTLCCFRNHELSAALALRPRVSEHDPALAEAIAIRDFVGAGRLEVLMVGATPESVGIGVGLSAAMSRAASAAAEEIASELARCGIRPVQRPAARISADFPFDSAVFPFDCAAHAGSGAQGG
ncbi:MAG TPA: hydrogenase maturation protease [Candidatus Binatia bacterium]|jgi:hydrogenase maturation protease